MKVQEITNKYNQMLADIDKVFHVKGKSNCYACESCGHITKCTHIDQGVTPFMHKCESCGEMAQSSGFRDLIQLGKPTEEWYRPTLEEVLKMDVHSGTFEHVIKGGLLCRKIQKIEQESAANLNNIQNSVEHRAIALFDEKFGKDRTTRFLKVREEFYELQDAFSEFIITGSDDHLRDEICDLQATLTHFASLFDLHQKQMLDTAIDKVKTRETDPYYKKYEKVKGIRHSGTAGMVGSISPFESSIALLKSHLENNCKVIVIGENCVEDITCIGDFSHFDKMRSLEMEITGPPIILNDYKMERCFEPREPKPWDRKELNRRTKSNFKKKRRK